MPTTYQGRRGARRNTVRRTTAEQPKKYLKNFGRQLFIASLCLTVIFFAKDIDHPLVKQSRETVKYALNYNIDLEWIQTGMTSLLQNWTDNATSQNDAVPAVSDTAPTEPNSQNITEGTPNHAKEEIPQENQT